MTGGTRRGTSARGVEAEVPRPRSADAAVCACGHAAALHEHFRAGSDCGICGIEGCAQYTPAAEVGPASADG